MKNLKNCIRFFLSIFVFHFWESFKSMNKLWNHFVIPSHNQFSNGTYLKYKSAKDQINKIRRIFFCSKKWKHFEFFMLSLAKPKSKQILPPAIFWHFVIIRSSGVYNLQNRQGFPDFDSFFFSWEFHSSIRRISFLLGNYLIWCAHCKKHDNNVLWISFC